MGAVQRGQSGRETIGDGAARPGLHLLPIGPVAALVQVRMPASHLRNQRVRDVVRVELAVLLGDHRMEEHLEEDVAQLLANRVRVAGSQRIVELVRLLDEIGAQRVVRLLAIPLAARAQIAHERERIFKR